MQRTFILTPVAVFLLLVSCASTEQIPRSHMKARAFTLNMKTLQGPATVMLAGESEPRRTLHLSIVGDSLQWVEPVSLSPISMPLDDIHSFTIRSKTEGLLWGALIGAVGGAAIGLMLEDDDDAPFPLGDPTLTLFIGGYSIGGLIGSLVGVPSTYEITPPPPGE